MAEKELERPKPASAELAAATSLVPVRDTAVPFPSPQDLLDLDSVTHVRQDVIAPDAPDHIW